MVFGFPSSVFELPVCYSVLTCNPDFSTSSTTNHCDALWRLQRPQVCRHARAVKPRCPLHHFQIRLGVVDAGCVCCERSDIRDCLSMSRYLKCWWLTWNCKETKNLYVEVLSIKKRPLEVVILLLYILTSKCMLAHAFSWSKTIKTLWNYPKHTFFFMRTRGTCKTHVEIYSWIIGSSVVAYAEWHSVYT